MERIANVLNLPLTYFYAADENEARLLVSFHRMSDADKKALLEVATKITGVIDL